MGVFRPSIHVRFAFGPASFARLQSDCSRKEIGDTLSREVYAAFGFGSHRNGVRAGGAYFARCEPALCRWRFIGGRQPVHGGAGGDYVVGNQEVGPGLAAVGSGVCDAMPGAAGQW